MNIMFLLGLLIGTFLGVVGLVLLVSLTDGNDEADKSIYSTTCEQCGRTFTETEADYKGFCCKACENGY